jgi:hypothetical protein
MPFGGHPIASSDILHQGSDLDDIAGKFVSDDDRWDDAAFGPVVPIVDVHIGAAHTGAADADEDFIITRSGFGNVAHDHSGTGNTLHESSHATKSDSTLN